MTGKGFGQTQPTKTDKLVEQVVRCCHQRYPEGLDQVFDRLPVDHTVKEYKRLNEELVAGTIASLQQDTDTLSWFCGYMASEINCTSDNYRPRHPITELSQTLIEAGMEPFIDFIPYPGCRIVIANIDKFESLQKEVKTQVQRIFKVTERSGEHLQQLNDALLEELVVVEE